MRAHLFMGASYYPQSGTGDYVDSFNSPEEAQQYAQENPGGNDWYSVLIDDGERLHEWEFGQLRDPYTY
jgi:hypothetical protein